MWLPSCPLRQKKPPDFHLSNPAMSSETLPGCPQISKKRVPLVPLGVMGWAGTERQKGLPESDRTESRSWLQSYSCETVGKSLSSSKNLRHLGNRGVTPAILSLWPLLLAMYRIEMVFSTLPLCCVGVSSSGSIANPLPMLNSVFFVLAWQGKGALSLFLSLSLSLSHTHTHTHIHRQEYTLTISSSLAPSGWITGREKREGSRRELPALVLLQAGFLERQRLFLVESHGHLHGGVSHLRARPLKLQRQRRAELLQLLTPLHAIPASGSLAPLPHCPGDDNNGKD